MGWVTVTGYGDSAFNYPHLRCVGEAKASTGSYGDSAFNYPHLRCVGEAKASTGCLTLQDASRLMPSRELKG
jgi:hypothetical protein